MASTKLEFNSTNTQSSIQFLSDSLLKVWEYMPNMEEAAFSSGPKALIDAATRNSVNFENPAANNIIRDILKTPSVLSNCYYSNKIGHTNNTFDEGIAYAQLSKVVCKVSLIGGVTLLNIYMNPASYNKETAESASRASNFICEIPNRVLYIAAIERQNQNMTNISFSEFITTKFDPTWVPKAIAGGIPKVAATEAVGKVYGAYKIYTKIQGGVLSAFSATGNVFSQFFPTKTAKVTDFVNNHPNIENIIIKTTALIIANFVAEFLGSYVFVPLSRSLLDLGSKAIDFTYSSASEAYKVLASMLKTSLTNDNNTTEDASKSKENSPTDSASTSETKKSTAKDLEASKENSPTDSASASETKKSTAKDLEASKENKPTDSTSTSETEKSTAQDLENTPTDVLVGEDKATIYNDEL